MDLNYWDDLADRFADEVIELAKEDLNGVLDEELEGVASSQGCVADLGCGPGALIPKLQGRFRQIDAVDFSQELLDAAEARYGNDGVEYICADLTQPIEPKRRVDVSICSSVLILSSRKMRCRILESVVRYTKRGGTVIVTVPSLESCLRVYHALIRVRQELGAGNGLSRKAARRLLSQEVPSILDGNVLIRGVPTHHWLQDEIVEAMEGVGLVIERVRRVEFSWEREITGAPDWLAAPYPWDWLVVARKSSARRRK